MALEIITVDEVLKACNGCLVNGTSTTEISGVSIDTRTMEAGDFFIAISGKKYNGHSFLPDACRQGAAGVIVSESVKTLPKDKVVIRVTNTVSALQDIAGYYRSRFSVPVVGITGSNGKTTTKEMTASILSRKFRTLRNPGNFNNKIGVPLALLRINSLHQVCVLEIGMNKAGETSRLAGIVKPEIGVITNIGSAHIGHFKNVEEIAVAKAELLAEVRGTCILNSDDQHFQLLKSKCSGKIVTFGLEKTADFFADSISELSGGMMFRLNGGFEVRLRASGYHNVYNALASIAVASCLDMGKEEIVRGLEDFEPLPMRGESVICGTIEVINDTYNANPDSVKAAIRLLQRKKGRKIAVIADMCELGEKADEFHRKTGKFIAGHSVDVLFTTGHFAGMAGEAAREEGMKEVFLCEGKQELISKLLSMVKPYDIILVKGSRAMGMEEVVKEIVRRKG